MRVAIAAGGTGGHIYPALAVARSLRARPAAPELAWIGGRRGLEAELVPPSGIPLRRLLLRSLRSTGRNVHLVLDPVAPGGLACRRRSGSSCGGAPTAVFTTGGYVAIPVLIAARLLRIPIVLWEGNVVPGRSVRATARLAGAVAVTDARTCAALSARRCYETGTPIRDPRSIDREAAREAPGHPGAGIGSCWSSAGRRPCAGSTRRWSRPCPGWWSAARSSTSRATTGYADRPRGARGPARRAARPLPARPVPGRRDDGRPGGGRPGRRAGPARRRWRSARPSACRSSASRTRTPPATSALNAEAYAATGAARLVEDAAFDAAALLDASRLLDEPAAHLRMSAAARAAARPGAADAVAALVAAACRAPEPGRRRAEIVALAAGGGSR